MLCWVPVNSMRPSEAMWYHGSLGCLKKLIFFNCTLPNFYTWGMTPKEHMKNMKTFSTRLTPHPHPPPPQLDPKFHVMCHISCNVMFSVHWCGSYSCILQCCFTGIGTTVWSWRIRVKSASEKTYQYAKHLHNSCNMLYMGSYFINHMRHFMPFH